MSKHTGYVSLQPDSSGWVDWSDKQNEIWQGLFSQQLSLLQGRACEEFMSGLALLNLPQDKIPQLADVNTVLSLATGWQVKAVASLINFDEFFHLLAHKQFPVATFIRSSDEFEYLQEPDIFHEVFGHCPLLTNPAFADFTHIYGQLGLAANKEDRAFLARLYWFTVEFGLVNTPQGVRIYGGGILSSPGETSHALDLASCKHAPLEAIEALRTPYRIDIMQPLYYVLGSFDELYNISETDIMALVQKAKTLGLKTPTFKPQCSAGV
jgi:phenylalanine-4-hydroxylase